MAVLIDTNLLLRSVQPTHPMHASAVRALAKLMERGEDLVVSIQNIAEFWNTATRPELNNGLGSSIEEAAKEVARLEGFFAVVHETAASYAIWKSLVTDHRVSGVQVHDARLVAVMKAHGVSQIVTFNVADFVRYPGIEVIHPEKV